MNNKVKRVAVVGAKGYAGLVLSELLLKHPNADLLAVSSRDLDWSLKDDLNCEGASRVNSCGLDRLLEFLPDLDAIFLALPAKASMNLVPRLLKSRLKIIDLSGAFRLSPDLYLKWYGHPHTALEALENSSYGLCPWQDCYGRLISNPGCYATAALMALIPLLKSSAIDPSSIIIDAKSGATGAGRSLQSNLLFGELAENFYPYKISSHQHQPEIESYLEKFSGDRSSIIMTTHLLPIKRGIQLSIYADLLSDEEHAYQSYIDSYKEYPLVKFSLLRDLKSNAQRRMLSLASIFSLPYVNIAIQSQNRKLLLFATIDNLMKGASSQAIENFNRLFSFPYLEGLLKKGEIK